MHTAMHASKVNSGIKQQHAISTYTTLTCCREDVSSFSRAACIAAGGMLARCL